MGRATKIEIRNVRHVYVTANASVPALAGVDLTVGDGEFVALLGPSGCGKSSLLRIVADLLRPSDGSVEIRPGGDANDGHPRTALVFQEYALFPWRTVLDNVVFSLEMRGVARAERLALAAEVLLKTRPPSFSPNLEIEDKVMMAQQEFTLRRGYLKYSTIKPVKELMDLSYADAAVKQAGRK